MANVIQAAKWMQKDQKVARECHSNAGNWFTSDDDGYVSIWMGGKEFTTALGIEDLLAEDWGDCAMSDWLIVTLAVVGWLVCALAAAGTDYAYLAGEFPTVKRTRANVGESLLFGLVFGPLGLVVSAFMSGFWMHGWRLHD